MPCLYEETQATKHMAAPQILQGEQQLLLDATCQQLALLLCTLFHRNCQPRPTHPTKLWEGARWVKVRPTSVSSRQAPGSFFSTISPAQVLGGTQIPTLTLAMG